MRPALVPLFVPLLAGLACVGGNLYGATAASTTPPATVEPELELDLVVLDNEHRIVGNAEIDEQRNEVRISIGKGVFTIARQRVKEIHVSLKSREAFVRDNPKDLVACLGLARWYLANKRFGDAVRLFKLMHEGGSLDLAGLAQLAEAIERNDRVKGPREAIPYYSEYRDKGGTDPAPLARLKLLQQTLLDYEARTGGLDPSTTVTMAPAGPGPLKAPVSPPGFEIRGWEADNPKWSNPSKTEVVRIRDGQTQREVLKIDYEGGEQFKAALERRVSWALTEDSVLEFHVLNQEKQPIKLAVAFKTGSGWDFYESAPVDIAPSQTFVPVRFDLRAAIYGCKANNYAKTGKIDSLGDIKAIQVLIHNGRAPGSLLVSGMGFRRPEGL